MKTKTLTPPEGKDNMGAEKKQTQEELIMDIFRQRNEVDTGFFEQYMTTSSFHRAMFHLERKGAKFQKLGRNDKGFMVYRLAGEAEGPFTQLHIADKRRQGKLFPVRRNQW